ncbi:MAG: PAS domain S-box protein [Bacteroidetes bacterium]|nr:PAS domain S-box protein [Bacteroidota bacterium]
MKGNLNKFFFIEKAILVNRFRFIVIIVLAAIGVPTGLLMGIKYELYVCILLGVIIIFYNSLGYFYVKKKGDAVELNKLVSIILFQILADIIIITGIIHFSGGVFSPYAFFYFFPIVAITLCLSDFPRFCYYSSATVNVSYVAMLFLEYFNVIPPPEVYSELLEVYANPFQLISFGILVPLSFWVISYVLAQANIMIKKRELALENSEQRFKQIAENAKEGIWEMDTNGLITYSNSVIENMMGYKLEEVVGKKYFYDSFCPEEKEKLKNIIFDKFKQKIPFRDFPNLYKIKNGEYLHFLTSGVPILDDKGNLLGYRGANIDITKQKRAELIQQVILNIANANQVATGLKEIMQIIQKELGRLMDTHNFYIALYNKKTDYIHIPYYQDEKDDIVDFPAEKTLTGIVIKQGVSLLLNDANAKKLEEEGKIESVGFDSEIWLGVPLKIKGEVTGAFVVQSYSNPNAYSEKDKEVLEIISHQISISIERKKTEQKLVRALKKATESDRLKTAFLATMSHELRTPLNAIIGFSSVIHEDLPISDIVKFSKTINDSGNHLLKIIEDIFDISLIESGVIKIQKIEINLNIILKEIHEIIKHEQEKTNKNHLDLNLMLPSYEKELAIITDPAKLKQILINILKNALKFTHEGSIHYGYSIEIVNGEPMLKFYIEDTGIGIAKNDQRIIFEIFRQVDESYTKTYGGAGIGLAISKKLTELLGGNIWFESEGRKAGGTVFYFTIPYEGYRIADNIIEPKTMPKDENKN